MSSDLSDDDSSFGLMKDLFVSGRHSSSCRCAGCAARKRSKASKKKKSLAPWHKTTQQDVTRTIHPRSTMEPVIAPPLLPPQCISRPVRQVVCSGDGTCEVGIGHQLSCADYASGEIFSTTIPPQVKWRVSESQVRLPSHPTTRALQSRQLALQNSIHLATYGGDLKLEQSTINRGKYDSGGTYKYSDQDLKL